MSVLSKLPFGARPQGGSAAPKSGGLPPALEVDHLLRAGRERRRDDLSARVAELQWDLGGLVYEMAVRDRIRVEVLVQRAAALQDADAELSEVERILRSEQTATAGKCATCGVPHSSGAVYCWQCGSPLLAQRPAQAIGAH
jgi:hypothetical protein